MWLIYIYNFLHFSGDSISEVFSAVLLYSLGFSIAQIFVFMGLKWGVMAVLTPLMPVIASRIGYVKAGAVGAFAILAANLTLVLSPAHCTSLAMLAVLFVLYGIGGAFSTPIQTTMKVLLVPEKIRGAVNGRLYAIRALAVMAASFVVGFFLDDATVMIAVIVLTLVLSLVPLGVLFRKQKRPARHSYRTSLAAFKRPLFRRYIPVFVLRGLMRVEKYLIPLYIFLVVGDLKVLAVYIILSTFIEMAVMLVFGRGFDKERKKALRTATLFRTLSSVLLTIRPLVERLPIFYQIFSRIMGRGHDNIYGSFEQRIAKKSKLNPGVCAAAIETTICFSEMVACIGFCLLALNFGQEVFFAVFGVSMVAAWLIYFRLRRV